MKPTIAVSLGLALVILAGGCSHHDAHHAYNEPHEHNLYNHPDHVGSLHDSDSHRDTTHEHAHYGGNE